MDSEEKQIIDRIFQAIKDKEITLVNYALLLNNLLNSQKYKMLHQNQPTEYLCKLFNQLVETNTLNEAELTLLKQAQKSHQLNHEEEQIIKRIFYSIKRGRIKVRTLRSDERMENSFYI
ncbi:hypothetical protein [Spirulina sp. 06S082]|uniref:hypothetical protein n=1 Tax=Spirulina sp. 06S082 TaxID=3110248 RepID=UPI002B20E9E4|nr:hypothetical protein [Spirulina sp. 06S082]MEA5471940.1 hypothetical protein [Spirulina sp. 06S082]